MGGGLQAPFRLTLGGSNHGGVTVRVTSADPGVLRVAANGTTAGTAYIDIYVADGFTYSDFYVQGVTGATGTAVGLTATQASFTNGTAQVDVVPAVFQLNNLAASMTTLWADDPFDVRVGYLLSNGTTFHYAMVSGAGPLTVTFTSSAPTVGQLKTSTASGGSVTVTMPVNTYDSPGTVGTGGVAFDPLAGGTTTVSATAPGFDSAYAGSKQVVTVS